MHLFAFLLLLGTASVEARSSSGDAVTLAALSCSHNSGTISCTGGTSAQLAGGLTLGTIFTTASVSGTLDDATINLNDFDTTVNTSGNDHGLFFDGSLSSTRVRLTLTVNNQTSSTTRRDVQVRGESKAALYVKNSDRVVINNSANLVFATKSGGGYNDDLRGIHAETLASHVINITNSGTIGFATNCTANCGSNHSAIWLIQRVGGLLSVTNSGNINVAGANAVTLEGGADNSVANVTFANGRVTASRIINSNFGGRVNAVISGGSVSGLFDLSNGNDLVTLSGGHLTLVNGESNFRGGNDTLTLNGGLLTLGDATNGSKGTRFSNLQTINVNVGATMRLYLTRTGTAFDSALTFSGNIALNGAVGEEPASLLLYLPSGYTIGNEGYFTLMSGLTVSTNLALRLADLESRVHIFSADDNTEYVGAIQMVASPLSNRTNLRIRWSDMVAISNTASSMDCSFASNTLTCTGGSVAELNTGINARLLFKDITALQGGTHTGNLTINIDSVTDTTINATGNRHGMTIDGTMEGSRVTGNLTVNNQTSSNATRNVQVRGGNRAALYVKSAAGITISNSGDLVFSGTNYNSGLSGIHAISTGTGGVTITNTKAIGFASNCTANCGSNHRGIWVDQRVSGVVSISNSGNINVGDGDAIRLDGGTFFNFSTIALSAGSVTASRIINSNFVGSVFVTMSGGSASGLLNFGTGNDTMTVSGGTLTIANGTSNFGSGNDSMTLNGGRVTIANSTLNFGNGTDSFTVNDGTWLTLGDVTNGSKGVTFSGLETLTLNADSTTQFYLSRTGNAFDFALTLSGRININGEAGKDPTALYVHLPSGYTIGNQSYFVLINAISVASNAAFDLTDMAQRVRIFSSDGNTEYEGTIELQSSFNALRIRWSNMVGFNNTPSTMNCSFASNTLTCTGGDFSEIGRGINARRLFQDIASLRDGIHDGDLTVVINRVGENVVNFVGLGHGVTIDGERNGSRVTGNLTVNHQTTGTTTNVQVRHRGRAALYVKGGSGVTVANSANLVLAAERDGQYELFLEGIHAIATGTGNLTVTNNSSATIGFSSACTATCGANHRGIVASHTGTGNITIANGGTIQLNHTTQATGMVGILVLMPRTSASASVTITNTATINVPDVAVSVQGGSGKTATVNFNSGSRVTSQSIYGSTNFGGNSAVNISSNAIVTGGITGARAMRP